MNLFDLFSGESIGGTLSVITAPPGSGFSANQTLCTNCPSTYDFTTNDAKYGQYIFRYAQNSPTCSGTSSATGTLNLNATPVITNIPDFVACLACATNFTAYISIEVKRNPDLTPYVTDTIGNAVTHEVKFYNNTTNVLLSTQTFTGSSSSLPLTFPPAGITVRATVTTSGCTSDPVVFTIYTSPQYCAGTNVTAIRS